MDHDAANQTHAIERYLLGEMAAPEREAFEEHYFVCAVCADGIRSASDMMRDLKVELRKPLKRETARSPWRDWLRWPVLVGAYAAAATVAMVYQNTALIPDLPPIPVHLPTRRTIDPQVRHKRAQPLLLGARSANTSALSRGAAPRDGERSASTRQSTPRR